MDIKAYIFNSNRLNSGRELGGAWFTLPIDVEELEEKLQLGSNEKYVIADIFISGYGWPFDTNQNTSIEEINRLCALAKKLEGTYVEFEMHAIQNKFFGSFEEMAEHVDDIVCYSECHDMRDMARYLINKKEGISDKLMGYIEYESYGRHLESNGNYLVTSHGVFEYLG